MKTLILNHIHEDTVSSSVVKSIGAIDVVLEALFQQKFFLLLFGCLFFYSIVWSIYRNKAVKQNVEMRFWGDWFQSQKDEILVACLASLLLIEFDDVAIELYKKFYDIKIEADESAPSWVYLTGPVVADLGYRLVQFFMGNKEINVPGKKKEDV